jgi:two-component system, NarL family, response regulator LiaR
MNSQSIRVLIVDDQAMVRKAIIALLNEYADIDVVGEAGNGLKALELIGPLKPDVILVDLIMPVIDGIETIKRIIAVHPAARILVLTGYEEDDKLSPAIKAGAMGYLVKDVQPEELIQAIHNVNSGEPSLSPKITWKLLQRVNGSGLKSATTKQKQAELSERELEVLRMLSLGKTDQEIAEKLVLTEVTIRTHVSRILSKLGVKNRVEAALYAIRSGMVSIYETGS